MAIYSLHHSAIGKQTQESRYTASAHVRYITRAKALTRIEGGRMPIVQDEAVSFLNQGEDKDRSNARVIDKVMLALPRELSGDQRVALVKDFAERITQGRASWLAAFHESGKDEQNPHCHLVIRDRDVETGKRVAKLSEKGSTEVLRQLWEVCANQALAEARRPERVDRRTLKAQGVERRPTIHEGVRSRRINRRGRRIESRSRDVRNAALARSPGRRVDYPAIDGGRTRSAYNQALREQQPMLESTYWQAIDADQVERDFDQLRAIHRPDLAGSQAFDQEAWLRRRLKPRRKPKR